MKKILIIFLLVLLIHQITATCSEGQIDINSASAEELDEIVHVGPTVAGYIIDDRPFNSINELVDVKYISEGYLKDIINQGLACVAGGEEEEPVEEEIIDIQNGAVEEEEEDDENKDEGKEKVIEYEEEHISSENEEISLQPIRLVAQTIKSENDNENLDKNHAKYGFVVFRILLGILFMFRKNKYQNGFE